MDCSQVPERHLGSSAQITVNGLGQDEGVWLHAPSGRSDATGGEPAGQAWEEAAVSSWSQNEFVEPRLVGRHALRPSGVWDNSDRPDRPEIWRRSRRAQDPAAPVVVPHQAASSDHGGFIALVAWFAAILDVVVDPNVLGFPRPPAAIALVENGGG